MERRLGEIPESDGNWADRATKAIESDEPNEIYEFWGSYVDHAKAEARRGK